ncbi:MAG: hypothetical protein ABEJ70_08325 [Halobacteriaceae archaeon]
MVWPIDDVAALVGYILNAATADPLSAILVVMGAVLMTAAVGYFGALTVGALLELVTPDRPGREHPPRA